MKARQPHTWTGPDARAAKAAYVRSMFARIVPRYDRLNKLMTMGLDRRWRRFAVALAEPYGAIALDLATGTGDMALELKHQGARFVIAADFCLEMLMVAAGKAGPGASAVFVAGDALQLPFHDNTFDCLVNGFLLRNLTDLEAGLGEFRRVLKPGGRLTCLDLTHPPAAMRPLMWPWLRLAVPMLGGLVGGDFDAYTYLPDSLRTYPDAERLREMMMTAGFVRAAYRRVGAGTVAIHIAAKPLNLGSRAEKKQKKSR